VAQTEILAPYFTGNFCSRAEFRLGRWDCLGVAGLLHFNERSSKEALAKPLETESKRNGES
jgi:hypothetical protein